MQRRWLWGGGLKRGHSAPLGSCTPTILCFRNGPGFSRDITGSWSVCVGGGRGVCLQVLGGRGAGHLVQSSAVSQDCPSAAFFTGELSHREEELRPNPPARESRDRRQPTFQQKRESLSVRNPVEKPLQEPNLDPVRTHLPNFSWPSRPLPGLPAAPSTGPFRHPSFIRHGRQRETPQASRKGSSLAASAPPGS